MERHSRSCQCFICRHPNGKRRKSGERILVILRHARKTADMSPTRVPKKQKASVIAPVLAREASVKDVSQAIWRARKLLEPWERISCFNNGYPWGMGVTRYILVIDQLAKDMASKSGQLTLPKLKGR